MKWLVVIAVVLVVVLLTSNELVRWAYQDHGDGDQTLVFWVVLSAFMTPILSPLIHIKMVLLSDLLPVSVESWIVQQGGKLLLTPTDDLPDSTITDYSNEKYWSMLPGRDDTSQAVSNSLKTCEDVGLCGKADAFYLHPTTWYTSKSWNAPAYHPVTGYLSDEAIGPQQAGVFNVVGRVFAPRYRQMAAASFLQDEGFKHPDAERSLKVAYEDVRAAFRYYLDHYWDRERGIILAGHSQGSLLAEKLIHEFFDGLPLQRYLIAAYLPGWTIYRDRYIGDRELGVSLCEDENSIGCVISWRTFGTGGDPTAFLHVPPRKKGDIPVCVNPLNFKLDGGYVGADQNLGGLDLMHPMTMWSYITGIKSPRERVVVPDITSKLTDAECIGGHLYITPPSRFGLGWFAWPVWHFATFPGRNYHPYDYNMFFHNIRANVVTRVRHFLENA
mmetsp:Transcript_12978/g.21017  ORF Transcript_12978/g.21017 Transcript_12978/m.21017 type:complete len:443 (-) Transcript_12978:463-1791(-)